MQLQQDRLADRVGRLRGGAVQQHRELVAAEPRHRAGGTDHLRQPAADLPQQVVTGDMPQRVVHILEPVEVDQQQGGRNARLGTPDRRRELELELRPVGQPGQRIVIGEELVALPRLPLLGDVAGDADEADDPAVGVPERQLRGREPAHAAVGAHHVLLHVDKRLALPEHRQLVAHELLRQSRRMQVAVGAPDQAGGVGITIILRYRGIGEHETAPRVLDEQMVRHPVDHRQQPAPLLARPVLLRRQLDDAALQALVGLLQRLDRISFLRCPRAFHGKTFGRHASSPPQCGGHPRSYLSKQ